MKVETLLHSLSKADPEMLFLAGNEIEDGSTTVAAMIKMLEASSSEANITGYVIDDSCHIVALQFS